MDSELPSYPNAQQSNQYYQPAPMAETTTTTTLQPYASNPFRTTFYGLGNMLETNPISTLTVIPRVLLRILVVGLIAIVLGIVAHYTGKVGSIIAILFGIAAVYYYVLIGLAATTSLQSASQSGLKLTGKDAVNAFGKRKLLSLALSTILAGIVITIGLILLIVPGLILLGRLSLIPFVIYNEDLKALDAFKRSWQLTRGHTWEILGIHAAQVLTVSGSGGLLGISGGNAGLAKSYQQLKAYESANAPTGPTHKANYILVVVLILAIPAYLALVFGGAILSAKNSSKNCAITDTTCLEKSTKTQTTSPSVDSDYYNDSSYPSTQDTITQ